MYLACSSLLFSMDETPRIGDAVDRIADLGFRAMDLAAFEGWQNINPSELAAGAEEWTSEFIQALSSRDMRVASFNSSMSRGLSDVSADAAGIREGQFTALLKLAELTGCGNITLSADGVAPEETSGDCLAKTVRALAGLAEIGKESRVTISVETHVGSVIETPGMALELARALWPAVGLTYDPSHFVLQGIPLTETAVLFEYSHHVHVRDAAMSKMQECMSNGSVDFSWIVSELRKRDYAGGVTIEYISDFENAVASAEQLAELLRSLGCRDSV